MQIVSRAVVPMTRSRIFPPYVRTNPGAFEMVAVNTTCNLPTIDASYSMFFILTVCSHYSCIGRAEQYAFSLRMLPCPLLPDVFPYVYVRTGYACFRFFPN